MDYFPAFLKLQDRPVLIVGGGDVAARKARLLLAAGARLTVIAPNIGDEMLEQLPPSTIIRRRRFRPLDVYNYWLVVAATNRPDVQQSVANAADAERIFCNTVDDIDHCSFITPAIVDRSPLVIAISSAGAAPVLARRIRAQLEATLPKALGNLARTAGRWRARVSAVLDDGFSRRRFWERLFDSQFRPGTNYDDPRSLDNLIAGLLDEVAAPGALEGEAWLVGAGPGDPELLTLRALQTLHLADVIVHDRLVSDDILGLARRDAERISVGKTPGSAVNSQEEINALLVQLVQSGKRVCRLKGGDPFVFGRGGEEAKALSDAGLRCQVVPGITAAAGCAATSGIPLTHRDAAQSVVLLTAHGKQSVDNLDWPSLARDRQTLAVYMGVRRFPVVMEQLMKHGRKADTPIAIIEKGTTPQQRILRGTLGQLSLLASANRVAAPAMLIIGEVARLGEPMSTSADSATIDNLAGRQPANEEMSL